MRFIKNITDLQKNIISIVIVLVFFIILVLIYNTNKINFSEEKVVVENINESKIITNLNIGILEENKINEIDLYKNESVVLNNVYQMICNSLFEYDLNNLLKPKLIESFSKINNKTYIFKLKNEQFFSDGQVLTSNDVKNTIEKIYRSNNLMYKNFVDNIKNIKLIDNSTFRINLIDEEVEFEKNLIFPIINEKNHGTGDYIIKEIFDEKIVLENYRGVLEQTITINIYDNLDELLKDFINKKNDLIKISENVEYKKYLGEFGYNKKTYTSNLLNNLLIYVPNLVGSFEPSENFDFRGIDTWKKLL